jgi:hypothetical protein
MEPTLLELARQAQAEGESYILGCFIQGYDSPDQPGALFDLGQGTMIVRLFEYAIIPLAEYTRLVEAAK